MQSYSKSSGTLWATQKYNLQQNKSIIHAERATKDALIFFCVRVKAKNQKQPAETRKNSIITKLFV